MPTAIGTVRSATIVRIWNAFTVCTAGSLVIARLNNVVGPASVRPANTAAAANHFSCWRATPVDLRTRTTSDVADSTTASASSTSASTVTAWRAGAADGDTPSGLSSDGTLAIGPGNRAIVAAVRAIATAANHAAGLQRGERRCPSGKMSTRNVVDSPANGTQTQVASQLAASANGTEPGATIRP